MKLFSMAILVCIGMICTTGYGATDLAKNSKSEITVQADLGTPAVVMVIQNTVSVNPAPVSYAATDLIKTSQIFCPGDLTKTNPLAVLRPPNLSSPAAYNYVSQWGKTGIYRCRDLPVKS